MVKLQPLKKGPKQRKKHGPSNRTLRTPKSTRALHCMNGIARYVTARIVKVMRRMKHPPFVLLS